jgi:tRNA threonylcarbamoyladenosine biosynthesis protein TsaB
MKNPLILLIETATTTCSVALTENGHVIALKELNEPNIHASQITLFIEEVMLSAEIKYSDLKAVAVSMGPGSYTGLRIGVSTAKGLCYALDIPLIAIDTIEAMASGMLKIMDFPENGLLIPMLDARRMEVYTGIYGKDLSPVEAVSAKIIDENSFKEFENFELFLFGDGSDKFKMLFSNQKNIHFVDFLTSAAHLNALALKKFNQAQFEDVAYFEPFYLKDFLVTSPKKNNI